MSGCMNCVSCGAASCERVTALEAKCDLLAASLRKADADLATWQAESAFRQQLADDYKAERDQARAVLAETPENIAIVTRCVGLTGTWHFLAMATLAALRARAGMETTPAAPPREADLFRGYVVSRLRAAASNIPWDVLVSGILVRLAKEFEEWQP